MGIYFVKAFYEKEIYSPYDFMGNRLGIGAKRLATIIFQIGGILGQSVRVLVAALALKSSLHSSSNIVYGSSGCLQWDGLGWGGCEPLSGRM